MEMQSGLPVGVAAFVGRKRERAKVAELVARHVTDHVPSARVHEIPARHTPPR